MLPETTAIQNAAMANMANATALQDIVQQDVGTALAPAMMESTEVMQDMAGAEGQDGDINVQ